MDNDVFDKAQSVMTNRRMSAVSENQLRIDEISRKIPEISEINRYLFDTSKKLMEIISRRENVGEKIEKLRKSNLEAQNMIRNILVQNGYPEDYLDVYEDIKPIIRKYVTDKDKNIDVSNKTLLHNEIQQILSKANVGKEVIAYVPGLVIKHCDEKNALQTIYRAIIQKFGQKKGLDIYNRIKKHI